MTLAIDPMSIAVGALELVATTRLQEWILDRFDVEFHRHMTPGVRVHGAPQYADQDIIRWNLAADILYEPFPAVDF